MKILIHTMHTSRSVGASLQSCALGNKLKEMGHEPWLLYFTPDGYCDVLSHQKTYKGLKYLLYKHRLMKLNERFAEFKKAFHPPLTEKYTSDNELNRNPPVFPIYICGSDQVWNPRIVNYSESYFFTFAPQNSIKMSYAASIGLDTPTERETEFLKSGIPNMDYVGVREDTAVSLLKEILPDTPVSQNIDPTFFLDAGMWKEKAFPVRKKLPEKYILYYPMQITDDGGRILGELKKRTGLPCVSFTGALRKPKGSDIDLKAIGPGEFLTLCSNADTVLTNSFHGMALSVIFRKKLIIYTKAGQNSRMESLARLLGLNELLTYGFDEYRNKDWKKIWSSCYEGIQDIIDSECAKAAEFLDKGIKSYEQH